MRKRMVAIGCIVLLCFTACGNLSEYQGDWDTTNSRKTEESYYVITDKATTTTNSNNVAKSTEEPEGDFETKVAEINLQNHEESIVEVVTTEVESLQTTEPTTLATEEEVLTAPRWEDLNIEESEVKETELTAPDFEELHLFISDNEEEEISNPSLDECYIPAEVEEGNWTLEMQEETLTAVKKEMVVYDAPQEVVDAIKEQQKKYPHMVVTLGFFSLDGSEAYIYNDGESLFGACTIKAAYACYCLKKATEENIDIETYRIEYDPDLAIGGSGNIAKNPKDSYTVKELIYKLINISDNTAYALLATKFPMSEFKETLKEIGGATKFKNNYFSFATVRQRANEWKWIYEYEQSYDPDPPRLKNGDTYAQYLESTLKSATAYYLGIGDYTQQQHKSGWTEDGRTYMYTAADAGIINDKYILVIITRDDFAESPNADPVRAIGRSVNRYVENNNLFQ